MSETHPSTAPSLEGLVSATEEADYAASGFHAAHTTSVAQAPEVGRAFIEAGYFLEMITCQDRREDLEKMRLVYTFNRFDRPDRHKVHADVEPGASARSLVPVTPAADWMEREIYDMYGVDFADHGDLRRILLPDDADFHALLKDFGRIEDAEEAPAE